MRDKKSDNTVITATLTCLSDRFSPRDAVIKNISCADIPWPRLMRIARENRVLPQIGKNVARAGAENIIPPEYRKEITGAPRHAAAMNMLLDAARHAISGAAAARSIPLIPLKGISMLGRVCEFDERRMSDIDLLIKKESRDPFRDMMAELGYKEDEDDIHGSFSDEHAGENKYYRIVSGARIAVEAHWDPAPETAIKKAFPLPPDILWRSSHCACSRCEHTGSRNLSPESELLFCIHHLAARHSFARLMWFLDIHYLLAAHSGVLDADLLRTQLADAGLSRASRFIFRFLKRFFGAIIPRALSPDSESPRKIDGMMDGFIIDSICGGRIKKTGLLPGIFADNPVPYFTGYLFPPVEFLKSRFPGVPTPLLYPYRIIDLAGKVLKRAD